MWACQPCAAGELDVVGRSCYRQLPHDQQLPHASLPTSFFLCGVPFLPRSDYYDISVAVSTPKGLVVPVLRDVDKLSFADVEKVGLLLCMLRGAVLLCHALCCYACCACCHLRWATAGQWCGKCSLALRWPGHAAACQHCAPCSGLSFQHQSLTQSEVPVLCRPSTSWGARRATARCPSTKWRAAPSPSGAHPLSLSCFAGPVWYLLCTCRHDAHAYDRLSPPLTSHSASPARPAPAATAACLGLCCLPPSSTRPRARSWACTPPTCGRGWSTDRSCPGGCRGCGAEAGAGVGIRTLGRGRAVQLPLPHIVHAQPARSTLLALLCSLPIHHLGHAPTAGPS